MQQSQLGCAGATKQGSLGCAGAAIGLRRRTNGLRQRGANKKKEQDELNKKKKAPAAPALVIEIPLTLQTDAFRKAWSDWQDHRRQIRKRLTPLAAERQLGQLASWGAARAIAAIERSISAGWTGIFEEQHHGARNGKPAVISAGIVEHLRL
jgi:hypothetical protein